MKHTLPLSVLLPLVAGCPPALEPCDTRPFVSEVNFGITQEEFDAATDEDGELTVTGCLELCRSRVDTDFDTVESCREAPAGAEATTVSTGDTGVDVLVVRCSYSGSLGCETEGRASAAVLSRPEGLGPDPVAAWLARAAQAEASSVKAFLSLALELRRLHAPETLVERARSAALDEVRHARILGSLAAARGGVSAGLVFTATPRRSLVAFATENAVEGCVRETWSAAVAHHQAHHAEDPAIRRAFQQIALDETRHGELAHAIDDWARGELSAADCAEVARARAIAVDELLAALDEPDDALVSAAGLPSVAIARRMAGTLTRELWST